MAVSFPDIIGEYIDNPERFETGGVQYTGYFEPAKIAPEQVANLFLFLQNTLNVPLTVNIKAGLPQTGGLFGGGKPVLKVLEPIFQLKLAGAEAGLLTLPVTTGHIKEGEQALTLELKVTNEGRGQTIRPAQAQSKLGKGLIDSPVGLNLVSTLGSTFTAKSVKKAAFPLKIEGEPEPPERAPRLKYSYQTIWVEENAEVFNHAIQEINLRQVKLKNELTVEGIYATLYAESIDRFGDAGLSLRVGEAITLAKILTYSCQYFLSNPDRYNGLLVPMWERALQEGQDTTNALDVIRSAGYTHLLKLALAISFGLVAEAVGRQFWPLPERQAVISFIAERIETGQQIDIEFLYLPLLMAGTHIAGKIKLEGEDVRHSLALMNKAREARRDLFLDEDMAQANKIYNQILKAALP
ncbi:MAG TPA: hypothetical protein VEC93_00645 [Anaerolineae bacterium]|nr:hypothetical protein [Anaerolineae bacterium]